MMSLSREDCDSSSSIMPTAPPQQQHPAQMSAPEYMPHSISPGPSNFSTEATIVTADQCQQYDLQCLLQHKPPAVNTYTLTPPSSANVGSPSDSQSLMTSMQNQQQHHLVSSLSKNSSSSEMNYPNAMQMYGRLPETNAATSVPGIVLTTTIPSSSVHHCPSLLNSNNNSSYSTNSSVPLAQRLQPVFMDTASSASIVSSSPDPQQMHRTMAITPFTTCPPLPHGVPTQVAVYPPSPPLQHQQLHLFSVGDNGAAREGLMAFTTLGTAPPSLPLPGAAATTMSVSGLAGLEDLQNTHQRPFRFKVLPPPPPTFEAFLMMWETNAPDRRSSLAATMDENTSGNNITPQLEQQQGFTYVKGHSNCGGSSAMERGNVEAVLRASTSERVKPPQSTGDLGASTATEDNAASDGAAPPKAATALSASDSARISAESSHSTPERRAMLIQYRQILERWWACMVIFESKREVRQRLGNLRPCPSFAYAQQAVAAASSVGSRNGNEVLGGLTDTWQTDVLAAAELSAVSRLPTTADPFAGEEVVLQVWSTLLLQWWKETKQRRRPRRSRCEPPRGGAPTRDDDNETHDSASLESVNSYELLSTEEGHVPRSLPQPDNDALLHFDFTLQSASSSQTDSL